MDFKIIENDYSRLSLFNYGNSPINGHSHTAKNYKMHSLVNIGISVLEPEVSTIRDIPYIGPVVKFDGNTLRKSF